MVILRLRRAGRRHSPDYRLVAQEKRSKLNGDYIENLGHFHPAQKSKELIVNKERVEFWLQNGAQLSATANNLLIRAGILPSEDKITKVYTISNKRKAKKDKSTPTAAAPASPEATPDTTLEEKKPDETATDAKIEEETKEEPADKPAKE